MRRTEPTYIVTAPSIEDIRRAFDPYVAAVGRVAHAWNYLHEKLGQLFVAVTGADRGIILAVWYSTPNDRAQRRMLRAAINASAADKWEPRLPTARDDLLWLVKEADELAGARDNAVHVPCSTYTDSKGTGMFAAFFNGHPRARKLIGKKLIDEFLWCEECAEVLSRFSMRAEAALAPQQYPWPNKPDIPTRERKRTLESPRRLINVGTEARRLQSPPE